MSTALTDAALAQFERIMQRSARDHGTGAARRYRLLFAAALDAIAEDPMTPGSAVMPSSPDCRLYPLRLARNRLSPGSRVRTPRHALVYRLDGPSAVQVIAVVHDHMDLPAALQRLTPR